MPVEIEYLNDSEPLSGVANGSNKEDALDQIVTCISSNFGGNNNTQVGTGKSCRSHVAVKLFATLGCNSDIRFKVWTKFWDKEPANKIQLIGLCEMFEVIFGNLSESGASGSHLLTLIHRTVSLLLQLRSDRNQAITDYPQEEWFNKFATPLYCFIYSGGIIWLHASQYSSADDVKVAAKRFTKILKNKDASDLLKSNHSSEMPKLKLQLVEKLIYAIKIMNTDANSSDLIKFCIATLAHNDVIAWTNRYEWGRKTQNSRNGICLLNDLYSISLCVVKNSADCEIMTKLVYLVKQIVEDKVNGCLEWCDQYKCATTLLSCLEVLRQNARMEGIYYVLHLILTLHKRLRLHNNPNILMESIHKNGCLEEMFKTMKHVMDKCLILENEKWTVEKWTVGVVLEWYVDFLPKRCGKDDSNAKMEPEIYDNLVNTSEYGQSLVKVALCGACDSVVKDAAFEVLENYCKCTVVETRFMKVLNESDALKELIKVAAQRDYVKNWDENENEESFCKFICRLQILKNVLYHNCLELLELMHRVGAQICISHQ